MSDPDRQGASPAAVRFRCPTLADVHDIVHVLRTSRLHFLPFAPPVHSAAEDIEWVRSCLLVEDDVTLALVGDQMIGVLAARQAGAVGWIDQLYLLPGWTGAGIGTALLERARARLDGAIRLFTFQQNRRARSFYEAHGFRAIAFSDGTDNEERCPDVLYELPAP